jgi:hypothetical protein
MSKRGLALSIAASAFAAGCTSGSNNCAPGAPAADTCTYLDASYPTNCTFDPGFTQSYPDTPNTIGVTFSGETLAVLGLPYVPNHTGDPVFVDGWSVELLESLVVLGNIRLDPGATQSSVWQDVGNNVPVASSTPAVLRPGPYVIDATRVAGFVGKDGVEPASGMFVLPGQDDCQSFDTSVIYAWSYDTVPASWPVSNINLTPSELPDYQLMVQNHWDKMIRGIATHTLNLPAGLGGGTPTAGTYPVTAIQNEFNALPQTVYFAFGWDDHTHNYNCVNPDNGNGVEDNLANRGVQTNDSSMYIAQITVHQDHVFWDTLEHEGEPLRFDPIAAWAPQNTSLTDPFWINNLTGQGLATTFSDGTPLPDRGPYMSGNGLPFTSDMSPPDYQVIMNSAGVNTVLSSDYPGFMEFSVQSQMHLNAQGLCYIIGQHSSDPYFTPNTVSVPYGDPEVTGTPDAG